MSAQKAILPRVITIIVAMSVIAGIVVFVGSKIRKSHDEKNDKHSKGEIWKPMDLIQKDREKPDRVTFTTPHNVNMPQDAKRRTLKEYYALRAYPGAPPPIPHPVDSDMSITQNCNSCHEKGGYVPKYQAFASVTPHPEYENCLQCHGQSNSEKLFKPTLWQKIAAPPIKRSALAGSPPPIPHTMQLRTNCVACHVGPAAPVEIRSSHPERVNCIQCHVPSNTPVLFSRPLDNLKAVTDKKSETQSEEK